MGAFSPPRQHLRVSTHLHGSLGQGDAWLAVTVLSLSEGGFYCEGAELDTLGAQFDLALSLESGSAGWSPKTTRSSAKLALPSGGGDFDARAELLYLDLGCREEVGGRRVGLGGRFVDLSDGARATLRAFISRETFRVREWRTRGGAVVAPPGGPTVAIPRAGY